MASRAVHDAGGGDRRGQMKSRGWFALIWGMAIAVGLLILMQARVTIPILLAPPVFVTRPIADILSVWTAAAMGFTGWISGVLLYEKR